MNTIENVAEKINIFKWKLEECENYEELVDAITDREFSDEWFLAHREYDNIKNEIKYIKNNPKENFNGTVIDDYLNQLVSKVKEKYMENAKDDSKFGIFYNYFESIPNWDFDWDLWHECYNKIFDYSDEGIWEYYTQGLYDTIIQPEIDYIKNNPEIFKAYYSKNKIKHLKPELKRYDSYDQLLAFVTSRSCMEDWFLAHNKFFFIKEAINDMRDSPRYERDDRFDDTVINDYLNKKLDEVEKEYKKCKSQENNKFDWDLWHECYDEIFDKICEDYTIWHQYLESKFANEVREEIGYIINNPDIFKKYYEEKDKKAICNP